MSHTAFVLAAGLGTRLRPLTLHRPKPLVPVCGVPMLAYTLAGCARHGHRRAVVNAHHLGEQLGAWAGEREGVQVTVVQEPVILGTGGGLRAARELLAPRFVVVNADVLSDVDLTALLARVPAGGAAMALRRHAADAARYGVVAVDAEGVVARLTSVASASPVGEVADDTHFTGLHALDHDVLALVPEGEQCVVRTAYRALVPQRRVAGLVHEGVWIDVGDPQAYLAANMAVLRTAVPVTLDPFLRAAFAVGPRGAVGQAPDGARVEGCGWIGRGAQVGRGAVLRDCVVGDGAVVEAGAELTRCVVWDGCRVEAGRWEDTIHHDGGAFGVVG